MLTVTGQFLDSVNVPPPGLLPELWAPGDCAITLHHLLRACRTIRWGEDAPPLKDALPRIRNIMRELRKPAEVVMNLVAGSAGVLRSEHRIRVGQTIPVSGLGWFLCFN